MSGDHPRLEGSSWNEYFSKQALHIAGHRLHEVIGKCGKRTQGIEHSGLFQNHKWENNLLMDQFKCLKCRIFPYLVILHFLFSVSDDISVCDMYITFSKKLEKLTQGQL